MMTFQASTMSTAVRIERVLSGQQVPRGQAGDAGHAQDRTDREGSCLACHAAVAASSSIGASRLRLASARDPRGVALVPSAAEHEHEEQEDRAENDLDDGADGVFRRGCRAG